MVPCRLMPHTCGDGLGEYVQPVFDHEGAGSSAPGVLGWGIKSCSSLSRRSRVLDMQRLRFAVVEEVTHARNPKEIPNRNY